MSLWSRLTNVFRSGRVERELDEELQFHIDERIRELTAAGDDARGGAAREVARRFGSPLRLREQSLDVKLLPWLDSLVRDVRLGVRMLRKNAVVTGAAVVSLSLALGACVAAFSLVDALILRPLPVRRAGTARLPRVSHLHRPSGPRATPSTIPLFVRLRDAVARARRPVRDEHAGDAAGDVRRRGRREGTGPHAVRLRRRVRSARRRAGRRTAAHARRTTMRPGAHPGGGRQPCVLAAAVRRRSRGRRALAHAGGSTSSRSSAWPSRASPGVEPGRPTDVWLPYAMYNPRAFGNFASAGSASSDA